MGSKKYADFMLIGIFWVALLSPLGGLVVGTESRSSLDENRILAAPPTLTLTAE